MDDEVVTELTPVECWEMLREDEFGRLAYRIVDEVHITPINYAVEGDTLLFRTAEGTKLLAVVMGAEVAFEIDGTARSRHAASSYADRTTAPRGRGASCRERRASSLGAGAEVQRRRDPAEGGVRAGLRAVPSVAAPEAARLTGSARRRSAEVVAPVLPLPAQHGRQVAGERLVEQATCAAGEGQRGAQPAQRPGRTLPAGRPGRRLPQVALDVRRQQVGLLRGPQTTQERAEDPVVDRRERGSRQAASFASPVGRAARAAAPTSASVPGSRDRSASIAARRRHRARRAAYHPPAQRGLSGSADLARGEPAGEGIACRASRPRHPAEKASARSGDVRRRRPETQAAPVAPAGRRRRCGRPERDDPVEGVADEGGHHRGAGLPRQVPLDEVDESRRRATGTGPRRGAWSRAPLAPGRPRGGPGPRRQRHVTGRRARSGRRSRRARWARRRSPANSGSGTGSSATSTSRWPSRPASRRSRDADPVRPDPVPVQHRNVPVALDPQRVEAGAPQPHLHPAADVAVEARRRAPRRSRPASRCRTGAGSGAR